jgi:hypothetical protein
VATRRKHWEMLSFKSHEYEVLAIITKSTLVLNLSNLCACIFYFNSKVEAFQLKYEGGA